MAANRIESNGRNGFAFCNKQQVFTMNMYGTTVKSGHQTLSSAQGMMIKKRPIVMPNASSPMSAQHRITNEQCFQTHI